MATQEYMTSQTYSATIGGTVYNVTANLGTLPGQLGWFNVKSYGAVGDGVTDDTTAIQQAITAAGAAGGGEVFVPSGSYKVTALTMSGDGVMLRGTGRASKIIAATTSTIYTLSVTGDNCVVDGITFVGGVSTEIANYCLYLGPCDGCSIRYCLFTGTSASAGYNAHIRGGVATNFSIVGNVFERVIGTSSGHGHGITMAACTDGIISHNIGVQTASNGRHHVYLNAATAGCARVIVSDNVFTGGTNAQITIYTATSTAGLSDITVSGNTLESAGAPTAAEAAVEMVGYVSDSNIVGNTIRSAAGHGIKLEAAAANSVSNISVIGNRIIDCAGYGITNQGCAGAVISGNTIDGAAASTTADAIQLVTKHAATDNCVVSGNNILGSTHRYGISTSGASVVVSGNRVSTGTAGPALLYLGAAEYQDNLTRVSSSDDTTPSVAGASVLRINGNNNPTAITQLDSAVANQTVTIVNTLSNNPVTIVDGGNFQLNGNWGGTQYSMITLWTPNGTTWVEVSRADLWDGHTALSDVAYDDIVVSPSSMRLPAVGAPGPIAWKTDLEVPSFDAGGSEYAYFALQLPHNYVPGTNLLWHIHFTNDTTIADGQTVVFRFRFTSGPINGVMTALGNADATFTNNLASRTAIIAVAAGQVSGTNILADTHMIAGGATITGTTFGLSTVLYGRLERLNTDTYTGEAILLSADAHIQKNRLGSETEYAG